MDRKKVVSILALIMAIVMILSLVISVLPTAFAIDESEIEELEKKKEELTARTREAEMGAPESSFRGISTTAIPRGGR